MGNTQMRDHFTFVGLGQCGMRICQQFQKIGFKCVYINSDRIDAQEFLGTDENLLLLHGTGTGKSLRVGSHILEENKSKFESFLKKHIKTPMVLFVAGAGGGTGGSFITPAVEYASTLGVKVGVLLTLPAKMLGLVAANNSLKTLQSLLKQKLDLFVLADNEYLLNSVGRSESWWGKVNEKIVSNFHSILEVVREDKRTNTGLSSIDQSELFYVLSYGKGLCDIRKIYLTFSMCTKSPDELQTILFKPELIDGYDHKTTLCYLICVDVPPDGAFVDVAKTIFDVSKKKLGNGIAMLGMCTDPLLRDSIRVTYIQTGLKLPKVLQSRIKNLKRDEENFTKKKSQVDETSQVVESLDLVDTFDEDFEGI